MIKSLSIIPRLLAKPTRGYHVVSLLQGKHDEEQIKLNPKLFHLYLDKLQRTEFNERFLVVFAVDAYRSSQPTSTIDALVARAIRDLSWFQNRMSLVVLLNQLYLYKYNKQDNKPILELLIRRAYELPEGNDSGANFYNLKLLILTNEFLGLQHFPDQFYRAIDFRKFKPLTLAMVLQLFYERGLQQSYPLTERLVEIFVACESFVPFADVHHLSYAIRKISHPKFRECFFRIRKRIQGTLSQTQPKTTTQVAFTTDAELLLQFRRSIEEKYEM